MQEFGSAWDWLPRTLVDWAQIFSAIGTCGAVIVSLWLAWRQSQIRIVASVSKNVVEADLDELLFLGTGLYIILTSTSPAPCFVTRLDWRVRRRWGLGYHQGKEKQHTESKNDGFRNPKFPIQLAQGQPVRLRFMLFTEYGWATNISNGLFYRDIFRMRADVDRLRLVVTTSSGKRFHVVPDSDVLDVVWRATEENVEAGGRPEPSQG